MTVYSGRATNWVLFWIVNVERAVAVDLAFSKLGGLGVRWSPRRGSRLTIRTGPQLELRLRTGRTVVISADDPQAAADVINAGAARP